jgi:carbamoyl-phosphate synthase large subunit
VDAVLGPEMKSTGEVMGIDRSFPMAFAKAQLAAGMNVPRGGTAFLSVKEADRPHVAGIARSLRAEGFQLLATRGTAQAVRAAEIPVEVIQKISEGRPNVLDYMIDGRVHLIVNTPSGKSPRKDEVRMRTMAVSRGVPLVTTIAGARAFVAAIGEFRRTRELGVAPLQDYHAAATAPAS